MVESGFKWREHKSGARVAVVEEGRYELHLGADVLDGACQRSSRYRLLLFTDRDVREQITHLALSCHSRPEARQS